MASIVKRNKAYAVVYNYIDETGAKRQRWESYKTNAEAKARKAEVEYGMEKGTFIVPSVKTLNDLLDEFIVIYGAQKWAMSTFEHNVSMMKNYIRPIIGEFQLKNINKRTMSKYFYELQNVKSVSGKHVKPKNEYLSPKMIKQIYKLLHTVFKQAIIWDLMQYNPVEYVVLPKVNKKEREIWSPALLAKAIELCEDDLLKLILNLAFACTLREGELLGLTWQHVEMSMESIEKDEAYIEIELELQRVNKEVLEQLNQKDVYYIFPGGSSQNKTTLVLKKPKTESSIRKVYLPKTVALMLRKRKEEVEELKELYGEEFYNYDLVFCQPNGKPFDSSMLTRRFNNFIDEHELPKVVFHSLRHTSVTYKLKLNGGDIKAVQGDSGHAQPQMVTNVYSHIIDEDRRLNARKLEETFYGQDVQNLIDDQNSQKESNEDFELIQKIISNPELMMLLKALVKSS